MGDQISSDTNEAQRQSYAAHPVIPNAPSSGGLISSAAAAAPSAPSAPSGSGSMPASYAGGDPVAGAIGAAPGGTGVPAFVSDPIGAANNFFRPSSPSAQSYRTANNITTDDSTASPRTGAPAAPSSSPVTGNRNDDYLSQPPGPITAAANAAPQPYDLSQGRGGFSGSSGPSAYDTSGQRSMDQAKLDAYNARDAQDAQASRNAMAANANWANAWLDKQKAEGEARVANFRVASGVFPGDVRQQREERAGQSVVAAKAEADRATAAGQMAASQQPQNRNFVTEAQERQESLNRAGLANTQVQQGQQGLQKGALELKHADLIQTLANRLAQEKPGSPEYKQLLGSYRVMIGKDASNYKTEVVAGETYPNPDNPAGPPLTRGGRVVTQDLNNPNEEPHEVHLGEQAPKPKYQEGQTGKVNGKNAIIKNGVPVDPNTGLPVAG